MKSKIIIKTKALNQLPKLIDLTSCSKIAVLTDKTVAKLWLKPLLGSLKMKPAVIIIPTGEKHKNVITLTSVWKQLNKHRLDRHSLLLNLGGGVICDLGGLAAATHMRGIDFIHLPTTLLAQVDASIGGKTAINFNSVKNLIGTFTNPKAIIIDPQTITTQKPKDLLDGFAEMAKHGLISDRQHFHKVTCQKPHQLSQAKLINLIKQSIKIKLKIVKADPQESRLRKKLNFGHTIGHALESIFLNTNPPLSHGQAVSLGMIAEAKLSNLKGLLNDSQLNLITQGIKHVGLPISINHLPIKAIVKQIKTDKKNLQIRTSLICLKKSS